QCVRLRPSFRLLSCVQLPSSLRRVPSRAWLWLLLRASSASPPLRLRASWLPFRPSLRASSPFRVQLFRSFAPVLPPLLRCAWLRARRAIRGFFPFPPLLRVFRWPLLLQPRRRLPPAGSAAAKRCCTRSAAQRCRSPRAAPAASAPPRPSSSTCLEASSC